MGRSRRKLELLKEQVWRGRDFPRAKCPRISYSADPAFAWKRRFLFCATTIRRETNERPPSIMPNKFNRPGSLMKLARIWWGAFGMAPFDREFGDSFKLRNIWRIFGRLFRPGIYIWNARSSPGAIKRLLKWVKNSFYGQKLHDDVPLPNEWHERISGMTFSRVDWSGIDGAWRVEGGTWGNFFLCLPNP